MATLELVWKRACGVARCIFQCEHREAFYWKASVGSRGPVMQATKSTTRRLVLIGRGSILAMAGVVMVSTLMQTPTYAAPGDEEKQKVKVAGQAEHDARIISRNRQLAAKADEMASSAASDSDAAKRSFTRATAATTAIRSRSGADESSAARQLIQRVIQAHDRASEAMQQATDAAAEALHFSELAQDLASRQAAGEDIKSSDIRRAKRRAAKAERRAKAAMKLADVKADQATRLAAKHADLTLSANSDDDGDDDDRRKIIHTLDQDDDEGNKDYDSAREEAKSHYGFDPVAPASKPWRQYDKTSGNVDEMGWTILEVAPDAQVIYVSSSEGNDDNDGLSEDSPKQTIAAGKALLRDGFPDHLLMKRGDVFYEAIGKTEYALNKWNEAPLSGRSSDEPLVFGAYGTGERPLLKIGAATGIEVCDGDYDGGNSPSSFLAFVGLHFYAQTRDPESPEFTGVDGGAGVYSRTRGKSMLIEDCRFDYCSLMVFAAKNSGDPNPRFEDLKVRRTVVHGAYDVESHEQGLFTNLVDGILIEECVFDHNGWNDLAGAERTIFNHNVYVTTECSGLIARGNLFSRGSSSGIQARPGGIIENNLFVGNATHLNFGWVWGPPPVKGGVTGRVVGNVMLDGTMVDPDGSSGEQALYGMRVGNIRSAVIRDNIVLRTGPLIFDSLVDDKFSGINNLEISNNKVSADKFAVAIYNSRFKKVVMRDNTFGALEYTYKNPDDGLDQIDQENTREEHLRILEPIGTYYQRFGGDGSSEAYIAEACNQQRGNWRWLYTGNFASHWLRSHTQDR